MKLINRTLEIRRWLLRSKQSCGLPYLIFLVSRFYNTGGEKRVYDRYSLERRWLANVATQELNEVPEEAGTRPEYGRAIGRTPGNLLWQAGSVCVLSSAVRKGVSPNPRRLIYPGSTGLRAEVRRGAAPSHGGPERRVRGAKRSANERRSGRGRGGRCAVAASILPLRSAWPPNGATHRGLSCSNGGIGI